MDTWWESDTVSRKESRKLLESAENNSLVQVWDRPNRGGTLMDPLLGKCRGDH